MSDLLSAIASPLGVALALLFAALALRGARARRICSALALGVLVAFSLPVVSEALIDTLESRYPVSAIADVPAADTLILLGGSVSEPGEGLVRAELGNSGDRIALAAELYAAGKVGEILVSSGNGEAGYTEADYIAGFLVAWGVPASAIGIEGDSDNTYENAQLSAGMLRGRSSAPVLLVTSATHLPRARALFCRAGIETIGVAANHWVRPDRVTGAVDWIPDATAFAGSSRVLREYLGIVAYAAVGRLDWRALRHDVPCTRHHA